MSLVNLGKVARIPAGEGRRFDVDGYKVAVFRGRSGEIYATQGACPHKGGPLEDGLLGGTTLICPLHGYRFDVKTGGAIGHPCGALKTHAVQVDADGDLLLALDEG